MIRTRLVLWHAKWSRWVILLQTFSNSCLPPIFFLFFPFLGTDFLVLSSFPIIIAALNQPEKLPSGSWTWLNSIESSQPSLPSTCHRLACLPNCLKPKAKSAAASCIFPKERKKEKQAAILVAVEAEKWPVDCFKTRLTIGSTTTVTATATETETR